MSLTEQNSWLNLPAAKTSTKVEHSWNYSQMQSHSYRHSHTPTDGRDNTKPNICLMHLSFVVSMQILTCLSFSFSLCLSVSQTSDGMHVTFLSFKHLTVNWNWVLEQLLNVFFGVLNRESHSQFAISIRIESEIYTLCLRCLRARHFTIRYIIDDGVLLSFALFVISF